MQDHQQPVEECRVGRTITASVWKNEVQQGDRTVLRYSVQPQKRYFDKADQTWKTSNSFFPDELPRLQVALQKAYEFVMTQDARDDAAVA